MTSKVLSMVGVTRLSPVVGVIIACLAALGAPLLASHEPAPVATAPAAQSAAPKAEPRRSAGAQDRGPRYWWKDAEFTKQLGLTPEQISQIDRIYGERQRRIRSTVEEYRQQETALNRMMRERTASADEVEAQARRMMYPYLEIFVSRSKMLYEISRVMTPEQNEKLQAMFEKEREQDRGRGRRGPGGNLPRP